MNGPFSQLKSIRLKDLIFRGNHGMIFKNSGFDEIRKYRYWDKDSRGLNFDGMIEDLRAAPGKIQ